MSRYVIASVFFAMLGGCSGADDPLSLHAQSIESSEPPSEHTVSQSPTRIVREPVAIRAPRQVIEGLQPNRPRRGVINPNPASGIMSPAVLPGEAPRFRP